MNSSKNGTLIAKSYANFTINTIFPDDKIVHFQINCINEKRHYNEASGSFQFLKNGFLVDAPQIFIFQNNWDFSFSQPQSYSRSHLNSAKTLFEIPVK